MKRNLFGDPQPANKTELLAAMNQLGVLRWAEACEYAALDAMGVRE